MHGLNVSEKLARLKCGCDADSCPTLSLSALIVTRKESRGNPCFRNVFSYAIRGGRTFVRAKWLVAEISGKEKTPGSDLFSHAITNAVSSALKRFTAVFEMGTGGAASLQPPGGYASSIKRPKKQCQREFDA